MFWKRETGVNDDNDGRGQGRGEGRGPARNDRPREQGRSRPGRPGEVPTDERLSSGFAAGKNDDRRTAHTPPGSDLGRDGARCGARR